MGAVDGAARGGEQARRRARHGVGQGATRDAANLRGQTAARLRAERLALFALDLLAHPQPDLEPGHEGRARIRARARSDADPTARRRLPANAAVLRRGVTGQEVWSRITSGSSRIPPGFPAIPARPEFLHRLLFEPVDFT